MLLAVLPRYVYGLHTIDGNITFNSSHESSRCLERICSFTMCCMDNHKSQLLFIVTICK